MTGSMCLQSAALGGMSMGKFKGQMCLSKHKGKKTTETVKQQDFLLEASEQKVKNLLHFSCTKT